MNCHWWNRWLHQRKREIDVIALLPELRFVAERRAAMNHVPFTEDYFRAVERAIDAAFEMHKTLPGQEHWRCPCAERTMISPVASASRWPPRLV